MLHVRDIEYCNSQTNNSFFQNLENDFIQIFQNLPHSYVQYSSLYYTSGNKLCTTVG